ncbi:hypothetical protein ASG52_23330 [Methylobacterium sp. Leaf456]|uniref:DUF1178 family protein n=1 Tax=Methylobacterium sp. Leaf456 TaxID=1736382 RepID=UPI0006FAA5FC|nr:DUF1178 family protein [Methylobacterium sp. Leaf456]KQT57689.1 hypothetical protein ASG52_23330 [Methylobacterium sp. Leaf456]
MIRFTLVCDSGHGFESWFPSGSAYDEQAARGLVTCPVCDSAKVTKAPMAPAVARTDRDRRPAAEPAGLLAVASPQPAAPVPMIAEPERRLRALLKAVREHVVATAEHVGDRFAEEARAIHYGDAEGRPIYGEASPHEARELAEEGIGVMPLPPSPDDRN